MRDALRFQGGDGGQRTEQGIAVIGAAAAVQFVALDHRRPRAEIGIPAGHFRLLVQVAVHQHAVLALAVDFDEDQRRAVFQTDDLDLHAVDGLSLGPVGQQLRGLFHVTVLLPVGVEHRRLVGDFDVFNQLADDIGVPAVGDEGR